MQKNKVNLKQFKVKIIKKEKRKKQKMKEKRGKKGNKIYIYLLRTKLTEKQTGKQN